MQKNLYEMNIALFCNSRSITVYYVEKLSRVTYRDWSKIANLFHVSVSPLISSHNGVNLRLENIPKVYMKIQGLIRNFKQKEKGTKKRGRVFKIFHGMRISFFLYNLICFPCPQVFGFQWGIMENREQRTHVGYGSRNIIRNKFSTCLS